MERHVPDLYDWVRNNNEAAPVMQCAILDVVSWFPGVLQQPWIDVSVHAERYNESASNQGVVAVVGEAEKRKRYGTAVRSLVFQTNGRLGGEGTKLLRDLVATAAANGQCSPHAVGRWDPAGASAADCTSRHILASAGIQSCGATCCWASSAAGRADRAQFCLEVLALRLSCEGSSGRDRDRDRGFGCIAGPSVWLLFVLCCGPLACAHSVHARMGKRRSEDDGLDTGFGEGSRPAEDQAGIVCYEISVMVPQMTRRIFWTEVTSDMEHLNRLVLQNQQTQALLEWQQQPQQQRLIAGPLPYEQPRALPRRSRGRSRLQRVSR